MLYTVSSRYRKAKDVCSHSRLFLSQTRPQRSLQGCHCQPSPEGTETMSSITSIASTGPHNKRPRAQPGNWSREHPSSKGRYAALEKGRLCIPVGTYRTPSEGLCAHIPRVQVSDSCPPKAVGVVFWGERGRHKHVQVY